jgi:hypothetical protein
MLLNESHAVPIRKGAPRPQDAITPIPASASSYEMTSEDDIGDALTLLAENGDAISMFSTGTREPALGRILSVDPKLPHFVMELNRRGEPTAWQGHLCCRAANWQGAISPVQSGLEFDSR